MGNYIILEKTQVQMCSKFLKMKWSHNSIKNNKSDFDGKYYRRCDNLGEQHLSTFTKFIA